ncbi:hypothetical protein [Streptomyces sporangiiformans]|uniref:Uncharacterized protein n=1 Tax=Streptomyces sporangiiformans TaxID=2315329 RepID=A0A505DQN2_9ACTN|nr:hypothetical protein [Streptomyces sporangiiformans]TPQ23463.1 hypothetical protein FGD71_004390 [Streptomyces sporangiiformans]
MTGFSDACTGCTASSMTDAMHLASDVKDEQGGLLSGFSTLGVIAMVLVVALVLGLTAELAWRERRQRRQGEPLAPSPQRHPHEGESRRDQGGAD